MLTAEPHWPPSQYSAAHVTTGRCVDGANKGLSSPGQFCRLGHPRRGAPGRKLCGCPKVSADCAGTSRYGGQRGFLLPLSHLLVILWYRAGGYVGNTSGSLCLHGQAPTSEHLWYYFGREAWLPGYAVCVSLS